MSETDLTAASGKALASIMEVLANAAVAEICKLVDDDYAVVSLQMSQCQRENKALKRKLHLLELKMARGNAERRLRDSAANSGGNGRTRVHIGGGDRFRETAAPTGGVFDQQVDVGSWSGKDAATGCTINQAIHSDDMLPKSPDVGLEEHKELLVKEENVEANKVEEPEEDVPLIGDDGVLEIVHRGASGQSARPGQQDNHPQTSRARPPSGSSRGVEVSDSSPVLNCPPSTCAEGTGSLQDTIASSQYVDDGNSDSQFDVLCDSNKSANSLVGDIFDEPPGAELEGPKLSSSFSLAAADFPSTSSSVNGWARYNSSFMMPQPLGNNDRGGTSSALHHRKERLFVCSFCGKAFNRPKKVEIHQRIHTGERPFSCSTCGKMFSEAGNLRKHQRVHTGEKPYSCRLCGKGFAWIRNLKTHQQKNHPEYQSEDVAEELT